MYRTFRDKQDECIKVVMRPGQGLRPRSVDVPRPRLPAFAIILFFDQGARGSTGAGAGTPAGHAVLLATQLRQSLRMQSGIMNIRARLPRHGPQITTQSHPLG